MRFWWIYLYIKEAFFIKKDFMLKGTYAKDKATFSCNRTHQTPALSKLEKYVSHAPFRRHTRARNC